MKTTIVSKYLLVISAIIMASCSANKPVENKQDEESAKILVRVQRVETKEVEQEVVFTGNVEAFKQNHISSSSPNRIGKIYVEVGDMVKQGQLLVQMDETMFAQTKTQLLNLERDFARLDTLNQVGSISQQQVDQVKTQLEVLRSTFRSMTENTQLRSPIDGIITGRYFNDGEMYSMTPTLTGKPAIVSVMQIQPVKVLVNIPEIYFPRVKPGMEASITLDIYPDKEFLGKVYLVYPTIEPMTKTFTVEVEIPNQQMLVRPGMFARVKFGFGKMDRLMVPDLAVQKQTGTNERYVFAVEDNVAVRKTISLGRRINDNFEVISGIDVNDMVVIAGQARLLDGTPVEIERN